MEASIHHQEGLFHLSNCLLCISPTLEQQLNIEHLKQIEKMGQERNPNFINLLNGDVINEGETDSNNSNLCQDWRYDKDSNDGYRENWCAFGKKCRYGYEKCRFKHPEHVGLKKWPSRRMWCKSCQVSKGTCSCNLIDLGNAEIKNKKE